MSVGLEVVAVAKSKKAPKPQPETWTTKPIIMTMRGTAGFKEWLERLAATDRASVAEMMERAAIRYAKFIGFDEEPPDR